MSEEKKDETTPKEGPTSVGIVSDPGFFSCGFIPSLPDAIVIHFHSNPPEALAFVGQAREKFFAQVLQAGVVMGMASVEPGEEEILAELEKNPTLH